MLKFLFSISVFILTVGPAFAQSMSQEDIAAAVEAMRNSGTPEETIQQFLDGVAQANALQQNMLALQNQGLSESEAAMRASGSDAEDTATVGGIVGFFSALGQASEQNKLKREITAFAEAHAEKPDVIVIADNIPFQLKLLRCDFEGSTYRINAEGLPTQAGRKGPTLSISRSGPYASGSGDGYYLEAINFQSTDMEAHADHISGGFENGGFRHEAMAQPRFDASGPIPLKIEFQCSN